MPDAESPLRQLSSKTGRDFPHLFQARERTVEQLETKREHLDALQHDGDVSIVLMGSWGRAEVTSQSDDDFMLLVTGSGRDNVPPVNRRDQGRSRSSARRPRIFGSPVFGDELIEKIGLDQD